MFLGCIGRVNWNFIARRVTRIVPALFVFVWGVQILAAPSVTKNNRKRLESLIVDVNGERRRVSPEEGFSVVRGDLLTFVEAITIPASDSKYSVNLKGFNDSESASANDLGIVIDTAGDLHGGSLLKGGARRFAIQISGPGVLQSEVFVTIEEPQLQSFDIEVNGQRRRISNQDRLKLNPTDSIRVLDVRTNVRGNENVQHDLVIKDWAGGRPRKEIRFFRGNKVFARVPIDWKGS
jgi:hypothetical protein